MRCRYNAVNFLHNSYNRHPVSLPWGRYIGVVLWVRSFIYVLLLWLQYWVISWHIYPVMTAPHWTTNMQFLEVLRTNKTIPALSYCLHKLLKSFFLSEYYSKQVKCTFHPHLLLNGMSCRNFRNYNLYVYFIIKSSCCFKSLVFIIIECYDFVVKNGADL